MIWGLRVGGLEGDGIPFFTCSTSLLERQTEWKREQEKAKKSKRWTRRKKKKKKISPTSILQAASSLINDSLKFGTVPPMMSETLALAPTTLPAAWDACSMEKDFTSGRLPTDDMSRARAFQPSPHSFFSSSFCGTTLERLLFMIFFSTYPKLPSNTASAHIDTNPPPYWKAGGWHYLPLSP